MRIKSLKFASSGRNQIPGDSDDEVLFTASAARSVSVERLVLDASGLSSFSTNGAFSEVSTDRRPLYVQVRLVDRDISYVIGFRYDQLRESGVTGERVKPFDPSEFCTADHRI